MEIFMAKKKLFDTNVFSALLYVVLGLLLIIFPGDAISWTMTIAGIFFLIFGVLEVVKKNWFGGAVSIIIGIVILILGWKLLDIVLLVLGILVAIKGLIALFGALKKKKKNGLAILFAILTIVVGIVLAFGNGLGILVIIAGVILVINGVLGLLSTMKK